MNLCLIEQSVTNPTTMPAHGKGELRECQSELAPRKRYGRGRGLRGESETDEYAAPQLLPFSRLKAPNTRAQGPPQSKKVLGGISLPSLNLSYDARITGTAVWSP